MVQSVGQGVRTEDAGVGVMLKACLRHDGEVDRLIEEGFTYVVDADLQAYFDAIPHDRLVERVESKVIDGVVPRTRSMTFWI